MASKRELQKQWEAVNNTLADLHDLCVWPKDQDIADVEGELLEQLDIIEYQLGQDLYDRAWPKTYGPSVTLG